MHPLVDRIFRGSAAKPATSPADLRYILGLKWTAHTRAEINELAALEDGFRNNGIPNVIFDKVESGYKDISFWFYVDDPKRAFKALANLAIVSGRMKTMQAASADRSTMKFSVVYPK